MRESYPTATVEPDSNPTSTALVDRLDPAIGETTSVVGAMLTELLRRTLRGGVMQIDGELHAFTAEKVEATIAERLPFVEQAAARAAEETAQLVATQTAQQGVRALEQKTQETRQELAARIDTVDRKAEQTTAATAQELARQITEAEQQARAAALARAQELAAQIEETEKRVRAATQAEVTQQIEQLVQRSRKGTAALESRLKAMETAGTDLAQQLATLQQQRHAEQAALREEIQSLRRAQEKREAGLREQLEVMRQANESLTARVAELEKPRGFRRLTARWFGKAEKNPEENHGGSDS
jgi:hypothetical protein